MISSRRKVPASSEIGHFVSPYLQVCLVAVVVVLYVFQRPKLRVSGAAGGHQLHCLGLQLVMVQQGPPSLAAVQDGGAVVH